MKFLETSLWPQMLDYSDSCNPIANDYLTMLRLDIYVHFP